MIGGGRGGRVVVEFLFVRFVECFEVKRYSVVGIFLWGFFLLVGIVDIGF